MVHDPPSSLVNQHLPNTIQDSRLLLMVLVVVWNKRSVRQWRGCRNYFHYSRNLWPHITPQFHPPTRFMMASAISRCQKACPCVIKGLFPRSRNGDEIRDDVVDLMPGRGWPGKPVCLHTYKNLTCPWSIQFCINCDRTVRTLLLPSDCAPCLPTLFYYQLLLSAP